MTGIPHMKSNIFNTMTIYNRENTNRKIWPSLFDVRKMLDFNCKQNVIKAFVNESSVQRKLHI